MQTERRFTTGTQVRGKADGHTIEGYSAVFSQKSENLGGFVEEILPSAFRNVLAGDTICTFNHDPSFILGRTTSGTLRIAQDSRGLHFECSLSDAPTAKDVYSRIERGDVSACSFSFTVLKDTWGEAGDGTPLRQLLEVGRLYDVGPVVWPAYPSTTVSARSLLWENGMPPEVRSHSDMARTPSGLYIASGHWPADPYLQNKQARLRVLLAGLE